MTDLDPMVLAFVGILLYVLLSRSRPRVQAPLLLSARTLAGIAIALAALFTPQPPPVLEERKRDAPPNAPTLAQEPPDAGVDAAAPCGSPEHSDTMLAADPKVLAGEPVMAEGCGPEADPMVAQCHIGRL